jgi:diketogulonate reductase-like aldo/keto reductase
MDRRDVLSAGLTLAAAAAAPFVVNANNTRPLITRKIPSTGEALPVIGLGTSGPFEVGDSRAERAPLQEVLEAFFAGGAKVVDTSPMYSTAEAVLGDLLTPEMHKKVFLCTKVWTHGERPGAEQMARSGQLLKHERLDLLQVHNLMDLATHLKTLRQWKEQGRVRYIGATHFTVASHEELARIIEKEKLDFIQLNYSAFTRDAEKRLLPLAADHGLAVVVNRPFEDGKIFDSVRGKPVPDWAADFDCESWAQMFLKFIIAHPAVTCVIPSTGKARHVMENLQAGRGRLPDAKQRARIIKTVASL